MKSKSILEAIEYYRGTKQEMQLRLMLHEMREAADHGNSEVWIPTNKLSKLHMPTLRHEILELAGFHSEELVSKKNNGEKMLIIHW